MRPNRRPGLVAALAELGVVLPRADAGAHGGRPPTPSPSPCGTRTDPRMTWAASRDITTSGGTPPATSPATSPAKQTGSVDDAGPRDLVRRRGRWWLPPRCPWSPAGPLASTSAGGAQDVEATEMASTDPLHRRVRSALLGRHLERIPEVEALGVVLPRHDGGGVEERRLLSLAVVLVPIERRVEIDDVPPWCP